MSNTTDTRAETLAPVCSTVEDLFKAPEISSAVTQVLGKSREKLEGKSLKEKLEYLTKHGFMTSNNVRDFLLALSSSHKIGDFQGREKQVIAFLYALKDIEGEFNPGLIRRVGQLAKDLYDSVEIHKEVPIFRTKPINGSIANNVEAILNKPIDDVLGGKEREVATYNEMFKLGFSPINSDGEIVTPAGIDLINLELAQGTEKYLKVTSATLGVHYINQDGKILKIKTSIVGSNKIVTNVTSRRIKLEKMGGMYEKKEVKTVITFQDGEDYYVDTSGKLHHLPKDVDVSDIMSGEVKVRMK